MLGDHQLTGRPTPLTLGAVLWFVTRLRLFSSPDRLLPEEHLLHERLEHIHGHTDAVVRVLLVERLVEDFTDPFTSPRFKIGPSFAVALDPLKNFQTHEK